MKIEINRQAVLAILVVGLVVAVSVALISSSVVQAVIVAAIFAVICTIILEVLGVRVLTSSAPGTNAKPHDEYAKKAADTQNELNTVLQSMEELAKNVFDGDIRRAILEGCRKFPELLNMMRQKTPNEVVSAVTKLTLQANTYSQVLTGYIALQDGGKQVDPDYLTKMLSAGAVLESFPTFPDKSLKLLRQDQLLDFRASLAQLQPPPFTLQLPNGN